MAAAIGLDGFQKWFKRDEAKIDNWLFRLHHQVSFAILFVGLIFIFVQNHLDGKAITCKNSDDYSNKFCWIHGTGHVADHLQGKVTHCVADQARYTEEKEGPSITYYLWLPFLLTALIGLAKLSRTVWKNLEGGLVKTIVESQDEEKIGTQFMKMRKKKNKFNVYQLKFFFCELLNMAAVLLSMYLCDKLFQGRFWSYGSEVFEFMKIEPRTVSEYKIPDPRCNLFPTEVSCDVSTGAITSDADTNNFLCILSNNIFNQHYFLIVWVWWTVLLVISGVCLVFRVARIVVPGFSMKICQFRHGNFNTDSINGLSGADFFVLDRVADNLEYGNLEDLLKHMKKIQCTKDKSKSDSNGFLCQIDSENDENKNTEYLTVKLV